MLVRGITPRLWTSLFGTEPRGGGRLREPTTRAAAARVCVLERPGASPRTTMKGRPAEGMVESRAIARKGIGEEYAESQKRAELLARPDVQKVRVTSDLSARVVSNVSGV